jgi:hypothetical protein
MLLGFFGKSARTEVEDMEAAMSLLCTRGMKTLGLRPDHRLLKRIANWSFIGLFLAWVAWGVFGLDYAQALAGISCTLVLKVGVEVAIYRHVILWRQRIDQRYPKPFASYL